MREPDVHRRTDEALARRAAEGDKEAFVQLYRRYVNEMYGFHLNQLGDPQEAEDLCSETFLRVAGALEGFDGRARFRTWLYAIARNLLRDRWRRQGRRPRQVELEAQDLVTPGADEATETDAPANAGASAFGQAVLAELPPRYRLVLQLRILDGRSIRDTAEEMGTTPGNVKVLQYRALKRAASVAEALEAPTPEARALRESLLGGPA